MKCSILICTYNRHQLLEKAIRSIVNAAEKPDELIIVNGGDEKADQVIQSFIGSSGDWIKLVKTVNKNLAASRNVGLKNCSGDIIAMTDDDAQVFPDWISRIKQAHQEHPEAGAIGGAVIGTNTDSMVGKVADIITFPIWKSPCYVRTLPGVNISYKKAVLTQIGWQDETLFRGEDVDFNWRLLNLGHKIYFDPAIKVYHYHRPTLQGFLNQHYMYGRAYYLVRKKWPKMYSIYPHQLQTGKDFLKGVNFFISSIYQPFFDASRVPDFSYKILSLPLLFFAGVAWRFGMLRQFLKKRREIS
jgi:glycosyltransferase involved in cell wall biosynthesis